MLTARVKRPLSIGVPSADLMLFFNGFSLGARIIGARKTDTALGADIAGIDPR
jgi:hypothetical protein